MPITNEQLLKEMMIKYLKESIKLVEKYEIENKVKAKLEVKL